MNPTEMGAFVFAGALAWGLVIGWALGWFGHAYATRRERKEWRPRVCPHEHECPTGLCRQRDEDPEAPITRGAAR
jgi:hypothetical protein